MLYHGVKTEEAEHMRMNGVPRSITEKLGKEFKLTTDVPTGNQTVGMAREFLCTLQDGDWERFAPNDVAMSGRDYKYV